MQPSPPPVGTAEDAVMTMLMALGRRMRQRLPGDELDWTLLPVLSTLHHLGPVRHSELSEVLMLDASTVSRKVRLLEERGLVEVTPDESDKRARRVGLLPGGVAARDQLLHQRRAIIGAALAGWDETDRARLRDLVERFTTDLEATTVLDSPVPDQESRR